MKNLILFTLLLAENLVYSQTCINFQDTTLSNASTTTSYGAPFYSNSGIDFRFKFVSGSNIPPIPGINIDSSSAWNAQNSNFSGNLLWLGDDYVQIDFSSLSYTNKKITFDISYSSNPTDVNAFNVNGTGLSSLPTGVFYAYTALSTGIHVEITGPINTIEIRGFEVAIDNLCFENFIYSQTCINFQDTIIHEPGTQTTYGAPFYSNSGINFRCKFVQYTDPIFGSIPGVDINSSSSWMPYNSNFSGHLMWLGDANVQVDFTSLSYSNKKITFDVSYASNPTEANAFNVNGTGLNILPTGVIYTYTALSSGLHVEINGPINTIEFRGFEVAIDNLCIEQILPIGIKEINDLNIITIYPNPTQNFVMIVTKDKIDKIVLLDVLGKVVQVCTEPINNQFDISKFNSGVYFIQIYSDNKIISKKIIKQD